MKCIHPIVIKNPVFGTARQTDRSPRYISVPCGKCYACKRNRSNEWAFRLFYESWNSPLSAFVTLTYDMDHLPEDLGVSKRDVQLFFKRLRKRLGFPFKYFLSAEYGGSFGRPHYHMLIFCDFSYFTILGDVQDSLVSLLDDIESSWQNGFVKAGSVTPASINYVCKYFVNPKNPPVDGLPETFSLMSKGLGKGYIDDYRDFYSTLEKDDITRFRAYYQDGRSCALPRYMRDKLDIHADVQPVDLDHVYDECNLIRAYDVINKKIK